MRKLMLLVAMAVVAAACSSGAASTPTAPPQPTAAPNTGFAKITIDDNQVVVIKTGGCQMNADGGRDWQFGDYTTRFNDWIAATGTDSNGRPQEIKGSASGTLIYISGNIIATSSPDGGTFLGFTNTHQKITGSFSCS